MNGQWQETWYWNTIYVSWIVNCTTSFYRNQLNFVAEEVDNPYVWVGGNLLPLVIYCCFLYSGQRVFVFIHNSALLEVARRLLSAESELFLIVLKGLWEWLHHCRFWSLLFLRNLPRAIMIAMPVVIICYVLVNMAYLSVMTAEEIISSPAVAVVIIKYVICI